MRFKIKNFKTSWGSRFQPSHNKKFPPTCRNLKRWHFVHKFLNQIWFYAKARFSFFISRHIEEIETHESNFLCFSSIRTCDVAFDLSIRTLSVAFSSFQLSYLFSLSNTNLWILSINQSHFSFQIFYTHRVKDSNFT